MGRLHALIFRNSPVGNLFIHSLMGQGVTGDTTPLGTPARCKMGTTIAEMSEVQAVGPGKFTAQFDPSWFKGPGACGGLVFAALARSFQAAQTDSTRRLRSLSVQLCAPAPAGPLDVEIETVRSGKRVCHMRGTMGNASETIAITSAVMGSDRPVGYDFNRFVMPDVPAPEDCSPLPAMPAEIAYFGHLDVRPCWGGLPMSGHETAISGGWIKPKQSPEHWDEALAAAMLDMWWPAILVTQPQGRPMGSITYHASFYLPAEPIATDFALLTTESEITQHGYAQERDMLWTRDGQLLAMAEQQILVIK